MTVVRRHRSLRVQLVLLGLVPVIVALAVLLVVAVLTEDSRIEVDANGRVVTEDETRGLSGWVPATAAALAVGASAVTWWWAGRVLRPIRRLSSLAEETRWAAMDRRLRMQGAPQEVQVLADRFDEMLDRLSAAAAVQRHLAEDAGHELRTPLAVMRTATEVVRARPHASADEFSEALDRVHRAALRMSATVDALLDRARAGQGALEPGAGDLAALTRRVVAETVPAASARDVTVVVEGPVQGATEKPAQVTASFDRASVERALVNLLDNAVRHSPAGATVTVTVRSDLGRASVTVTDRGPGIPPQEQRRVFDRYWRGDAGGTGIGLSIVRLVADAHDGIELVSPAADGCGTRVTLWFAAG